jgi:hypothetical protein
VVTNIDLFKVIACLFTIFFSDWYLWLLFIWRASFLKDFFLLGYGAASVGKLPPKFCGSVTLRCGEPITYGRGSISEKNGILIYTAANTSKLPYVFLFC